MDVRIYDEIHRNLNELLALHPHPNTVPNITHAPPLFDHIHRHTSIQWLVVKEIKCANSC